MRIQIREVDGTERDEEWGNIPVPAQVAWEHQFGQSYAAVERTFIAGRDHRLAVEAAEKEGREPPPPQNPAEMARTEWLLLFVWFDLHRAGKVEDRFDVWLDRVQDYRFVAEPGEPDYEPPAGQAAEEPAEVLVERPDPTSLEASTAPGP